MITKVFWNMEDKFVDILVPGRAYLWHNYNIGLFLGRTKENKYVFYALTSVAMNCSWKSSQKSYYDGKVIHPEVQIKAINNTIRAILSKPLEEEYIYEWTSRPKLLGEWQNYSDMLPLIIEQSGELLNKHNVVIGDSEQTKVNIFVPARSMEPGRVYISNTEKLYTYLGRDNRGLFVYLPHIYFMFSDDDDIDEYIVNPNRFIMLALQRYNKGQIIERTEIVKKVRLYKDVGKDNRLRSLHFEIDPHLKEMLNLR